MMKIVQFNVVHIDHKKNKQIKSQGYSIYQACVTKETKPTNLQNMCTFILGKNANIWKRKT